MFDFEILELAIERYLFQPFFVDYIDMRMINMDDVFGVNYVQNSYNTFAIHIRKLPTFFILVYIL